MGKEEKPKSEEEKDKELKLPEHPEEIPEEEENILSDEIIEKLPPEIRGIVRKSTSMFMAGSYPPPYHYIFRKMTPEHIGKVIDSLDSDSQRDHKERMSTRRWYYAYLITILMFILLLSLLFLWKDKSEYIVPIITAILGGAGGYGIGLSMGQKRSR